MRPDVPSTLLDEGTPELAWLILGAVLLLVIGGSAVRVVRPDQRAAVTRLGRICRVKSPGLVLNVTGLERVRMVSVSPTSVSVSVGCSTEEGVQVTLAVDVCYRIGDAVTALQTRPPSACQLVEDLQRIARHEVASLTLPHLLRGRAPLATRLEVACGHRATTYGLRVLDVEVMSVDVELSGEALRWLR